MGAPLWNSIHSHPQCLRTSNLDNTNNSISSPSRLGNSDKHIKLESICHQHIVGFSVLTCLFLLPTNFSDSRPNSTTDFHAAPDLGPSSSHTKLKVRRHEPSPRTNRALSYSGLGLYSKVTDPALGGSDHTAQLDQRHPSWQLSQIKRSCRPAAMKAQE